MHFTFITLFWDLCAGYFSDSIMKKAQERGLFSISSLNPRDFSEQRFQKVDEYMLGGGAGLLLQYQPISAALHALQKNAKDRAHIIFLSPSGAKFTQNDAQRLAKKPHIALVCGRYEGFDERLLEDFADEIFSIGDFILSGGELPALCIFDAIARQIPGVLGNENSLNGESFETNLLEAPNFTKPLITKSLNLAKNFAPSILIKGNHAKIADFKFQSASAKTRFHRPDLYFKKGKNTLKRTKNEK